MRIARVLTIAGLALTACSTPKIPPVAMATPSTGCGAVQSPPELSTSHIEAPTVGAYNTDPPTSGNHRPKWSPVGMYDDPIPNETQVHNLEHGHVVVQHRDLTAIELTKLRTVIQGDPRKMLMAPRPDMTWKVAFTSWGKIQVCTTVPADIDAVLRAFVEKNRDHAPESVD
jgi:hypothetical protein